MKLITIRISFFSLFLPVIVNILFKVMQQVALRKYFKSFYLALISIFCIKSAYSDKDNAGSK